MRHQNRQPVAPVNENIRFPEIRVIDADGSNLGKMQPQDALSIAQNQELDLVLVSETANPPVCRIIDYNKFKYTQSKKDSRQPKNQLKELKMGYKIEQHDYTVRINHAKRFLKAGNQVKATITLRGRENQHGDLAKELLERMANDLNDLALVQQAPKRDGRRIIMLLAPRKE